MTNEMTCPVCNEGQLHSDTAVNLINVLGGKKEVPRHFHWCDACGIEIALDKDVRINAREALRAKQAAQGRMSGKEIRSLREQLGISQAQAAKIFGGGPISFSKYENDETPPVEAMDNLLWLISQHTELVYELAERSQIVIARPQLKFVEIPAVKREIWIKEIRNSQKNTTLPQDVRERFSKADMHSPIENRFSVQLKAA
jgi:HTH-type transcriptional regulator/antitoxin MqsA